MKGLLIRFESYTFETQHVSMIGSNNSSHSNDENLRAA